MKQPSAIKCDCCGDRVAIKGILFYETIKEYVSYPSSKESGLREKIHYCWQCRFGLEKKIRAVPHD